MNFNARRIAEEEMPVRAEGECDDEDKEFDAEYQRFAKMMDRYKKSEAGRKAPSPTEQHLGELDRPEPMGTVPNSGINSGPRVPHTPSMSAAEDTSSGRVTAEKVDTQFQSGTIMGMPVREWEGVKEVFAYAASKLNWTPLPHHTVQ